MSNEHKLELMSKVCRDVLGQVPHGKISLSEKNSGSGSKNNNCGIAIVRKQEEMMRDVFWILGCSEIKVGGVGRSNALGRAEAAAADDNEVVAAVQQAKGHILSKLSQKHVLQIMVPELVRLKNDLELMHSPLLSDLMVYFTSLYKTGRQVKDIVKIAFPNVSNEIEYDLKKFDEKRLQQLNQVQKETEEREREKKQKRQSRKELKREEDGAVGAVGTPAGEMRAASSTPRSNERSMPKKRRRVRNEKEEGEEENHNGSNQKTTNGLPSKSPFRSPMVTAVSPYPTFLSSSKKKTTTPRLRNATPRLVMLQGHSSTPIHSPLTPRGGHRTACTPRGTSAPGSATTPGLATTPGRTLRHVLSQTPGGLHALKRARISTTPVRVVQRPVVRKSAAKSWASGNLSSLNNVCLTEMMFD